MVLRLEMEEIYFLRSMLQEIRGLEKEMESFNSLMFAYNITKYYKLLLQTHLNKLNSKDYNKKYSSFNLNWTRFFNSSAFKLHQTEITIKIKNAEM